MSFPDEYHQLSDLLIEVAKKLLTERGEFPPFSAAVAKDGSHFLYDAEETDESASSDPELIEHALRDGLARSVFEGNLRAVGLCTHSVLRSDEADTEIVLMQLCCLGAKSLNVAVPVAREGDTITLRQPSLFEGTLQLFVTIEAE